MGEISAKSFTPPVTDMDIYVHIVFPYYGCPGTVRTWNKIGIMHFWPGVEKTGERERRNDKR